MEEIMSAEKNGGVAQAIKKTKTRSPSYPSIDLETAIFKATDLKEKGGDGDYYVAYTTAMKFWGYAPKSSNGLLILAALKKYGLIEDRGSGKSREIRLTKLAQKILFYTKSSQDTVEYRKSVIEAALNPSIHTELWEKYQNAPDDVIKPYLVLQRDEGTFTAKAADDCITQYKNTISFAKLIKNDNISGQSEDKNSIVEEKKLNPIPTAHSNNPTLVQFNGGECGQTIDFPIKISEKMSVNLQIQYPLEDKDLHDFLSAIEALKPGLLQNVLDEIKDEKDK